MLQDFSPPDDSYSSGNYIQRFITLFTKAHPSIHWWPTISFIFLT